MPVYRIEDLATPYQWPRPAGGNGKVSWIVLHSPEAAGNPLGTVRYIIAPGKPPAAQTGYHYVVGAGVVYRLARPERRVGHAGVATRIPGTGVVNGAVNNRTVGVALDNKAGQRPAEANIATGVELVADLIIQLGLPDAGVVLSHMEITTQVGRRTDPTKVSMPDFRQAVHDALIQRGR